ncbi:MAG: hypothetical protein J7L95_02255 [Prolixibacteraceae bacterium]|nr:hypothetical protein [Prolixibacteraceae bacterium]
MLAMPDNQQNIYYRRLYPSTFVQHFGMQGFYHHYILNGWENLKPSLFYDIQAACSTTRNTDCGSKKHSMLWSVYMGRTNNWSRI